MGAAVAAAVAAALAITACADAPEPGDLGAFCSLLEADIGLSSSSTEADYAQLALVAPPEIRPTIESLQTQARDFDELLSVDPPDLAALFKARFDPAAAGDRAELDTYAVDVCDLTVARPPSTRWANFVRDNYADAEWRSAVTAGFEVAGDRIVSMSLTFDEAPSDELVEDACRAASRFLRTDGTDTAGVRILVGPVVFLEYDSPDGACRRP